MEDGGPLSGQPPTQNRGQRFTLGLSSALVGLPIVPDDPSDDEPLRRQSNSQLNRTRVQESERIVAAQLLMYSLPVMGCTALILVGLLVASVVIYIQGWMVISSFSAKPCDVPLLKWWLLAMLLLPFLQCQLNSQAQQELRKRLQALVMPLAITIGVWLVSSCKTCASTNPELFQYAKMYLIFQSTVWILMVFMSCGIVSFVFWMHRNGLLESGPGPGCAARSGLIHDIETVPYDASIFAAGKRGEELECAICQDDFEGARVNDQSLIKKTPCCRHFFHSECLEQWLEGYGRTCPICRADLERVCEHSQVSSEA